MVALNVPGAESRCGEPGIKIASPAHLLYQRPVRSRFDRLWRASDYPDLLPAVVLQPGGGTAGGVGWCGDDGHADHRCDLRSVDRRMVRSHAFTMGTAPSFYVRFGGSCRGGVLFSFRSAAWMVPEPLAHLHGGDAGHGASAAQPLRDSQLSAGTGTHP